MIGSTFNNSFPFSLEKVSKDGHTDPEQGPLGPKLTNVNE